MYQALNRVLADRYAFSGIVLNYGDETAIVWREKRRRDSFQDLPEAYRVPVSLFPASGAAALQKNILLWASVFLPYRDKAGYGRLMMFVHHVDIRTSKSLSLIDGHSQIFLTRRSHPLKICWYDLAGFLAMSRLDMIVTLSTTISLLNHGHFKSDCNFWLVVMVYSIKCTEKSIALFHYVSFR